MNQEAFARFGALAPRFRQAVAESDCPEELAYILNTMPLSDGAYDPALLEGFAAHGHFLREKVAWCRKLPEELFRQNVLYHRVNNEQLTDCRRDFYERLWPLVRDCATMEEAALRINYWCLEEATYRLTDERTASPATVLHCGFGRCGEESTFAVTALRAVGIPARQVYAPKWAHCDDNHAWVELWVDGAWHYLGACEPEESLDRGWFSAAASRAMLIHSRSFGPEEQDGDFISREGCVSLWNQLPRYAKTVDFRLQITQKGQPLPGVEVELQLLNYARFSPIARFVTGEDGLVKLACGAGDLFLHCRKEGRFFSRKIDLRQEQTLSLSWEEAAALPGECWEGEDLEQEPPKDDMAFVHPQAEEVKRRRQEKFDAACARRKEKEAAFPKGTFWQQELEALDYSPEEARRGATLLEKSYGNSRELFVFLAEKQQRQRLELLESLTEKDLRDAPYTVLEEALRASLPYEGSYPQEVFRQGLLCPRIGLEPLTLWRQELPAFFSEEQRQRFCQEPKELMNWIEENIHDAPQESDDELYTTPVALLQLGRGDLRSRRLLFVALCRSLGLAARLAPEDGRPQYWKAGAYRDAQPRPQGEELLDFTLLSADGEPWLYGQSWSLARLEQGRYQTLELGDRAWAEGRLSLQLPAGFYRLLSCRRLPTGALLARQWRFELRPDGRRELTLSRRSVQLREILSPKPIPDFVLYDGKGQPCSMAEVCRDRANLLLWLEEGKEPTEHILNELLELQEDYRRLDAQLIFVISSPKALKDPRIQGALAALPQVKVYYDDFRDTLSSLARRLYVDPDKLPLLVLCWEGLCAMYGSSGYNVGLGKLALEIFAAKEG